MKYNSIIEYIQEKYPDIITIIDDDKETFIIKNMFIVGIFKNYNIHKIEIPYHIGIQDIPVCRGFYDNDNELLLQKLDNSDLIIQEYTIQQLPYHIFYDKLSNNFIAIKTDSLYIIPKILKTYDSYLNKINECQVNIIENKNSIIKDLKTYKNDMINYIIDNKLQPNDIKKLHQHILNENLDYQTKLNLLYKCNLDTKKCNDNNKYIDELELKEYIHELTSELINLQNDLDKSQLKYALLERYKNDSRHFILNEKENIIKSIKIYHYKWLEWLESINTENSCTDNIDDYKYSLLKELKIIENKFKDLLKYHSLEDININASLNHNDFKKLKQNIADIQYEIKNIINNELVQLSIKDYKYNNSDKQSNDFEITKDTNYRWPEELHYIGNDLNEINNLLLQNNNTKVEELYKYSNISDCYIIIQNFLALNNIFYRQKIILKKLENIIYNNLPPFSYLSEEIKSQILDTFNLLKIEINNNINFLNLNSYINDANLLRFKTKNGMENYYKSRHINEEDFCMHLFNIIKFWNINKIYYRNLNTRLINIYEDISGQIKIYIRIKPYTSNLIENIDNLLINKNIYEDKRQFYMSIYSENDNSNRIYGDFHGIFDETYTNLNLYTGTNNKDTNLLEDSDKINIDDIIELSEKTTFGLYNTFKHLEDGYSSTLISYGNSGSGKSLSLFGDHTIRGLLYYGFKNLENVATISLEYLFEQYYYSNDLINNKISGKIHNLINNLVLSNLEISDNVDIYIDETKEFSKRLPSYIDINNISIDNIDALLTNIDNYRKVKGRICKIPNNINSNRSHLYMIFKVTFENKESRYMTFIDTASKESPYNLFKNFIDDTQTKLQIIMAPEPIGGISKIENTINKDILNNYSPSDVLKILNETFYINETINHMTYFLNKSKNLTYDDQQTSINNYNISKYFISPIKETHSISNSNCLTIPILNFINNLQNNNKFTILCCIRQEQNYYNQTIETLEFADKIKKF